MFVDELKGSDKFTGFVTDLNIDAFYDSGEYASSNGDLVVAVCAEILQIPIVVISSTSESYIHPFVPTPCPDTDDTIFLAYISKESHYCNTIECTFVLLLACHLRCCPATYSILIFTTVKTQRNSSKPKISLFILGSIVESCSCHYRENGSACTDTKAYKSRCKCRQNKRSCNSNCSCYTSCGNKVYHSYYSLLEAMEALYILGF